MMNRKSSTLAILALLGLVAIVSIPLWNTGPGTAADASDSRPATKPATQRIEMEPQFCALVWEKGYNPDKAYPKTFKSIAEEIAWLNDNENLLPTAFHKMGSRLAPSDSLISRKKRKNGYSLNLKTKSLAVTPTIYKDNLYVPGGFDQEAFSSVRLKDGKVNWTVKLDDNGPSNALVTEESVIFNTESCTVYALNRESGELQWAYYVGYLLLNQPSTDGKLIYVSYPQTGEWPKNKRKPKFKHLEASHVLLALDARNGKVRWRRWLDEEVMGTPVVVGKDLYLTTFAGTVYRIDKADGGIQAASPILATSLPSVVNHRVVVTRRINANHNAQEAIVELDAQSLQLKRTFIKQDAPYLIDNAAQATASESDTTGLLGFIMESAPKGAKNPTGLQGWSARQHFLGSSVCTDGKLGFSSMGNKLVCLDLKTGKLLWEKPLKGKTSQYGKHGGTMPILAGPYVALSSTSGQVMLIDKASGNVVKNYDLKTEVRDPLLACQGLLIAATASGDIHCIDTQMQAVDGWMSLLRNNTRNVTAN
ncbi:MAG: PQQ-binding-like beta-propeller repeat protein [Bacteroidia bacterium]